MLNILKKRGMYGIFSRSLVHQAAMEEAEGGDEDEVEIREE